MAPAATAEIREGHAPLRGIGKTFAAIGAVALATAGYVWVTLPDVRPLKSENPKTTAWMRMRGRSRVRASRRSFRGSGDY
jgi:hypothetical protein